MCSYGTRIDTPTHFIANGKAVYEFDLSVFYGKCTVVEFGGAIWENVMAKTLALCDSDRLLVRAVLIVENSVSATEQCNNEIVIW